MAGSSVKSQTDTAEELSANCATRSMPLTEVLRTDHPQSQRDGAFLPALSSQKLQSLPKKIVSV
jgi:hypothetical protein